MNKKTIILGSIFLLTVISVGAIKVQAATPSILYNTQVQNIGWQKNPKDSSTWFHDGQEAGTNARGLRMESIQIALNLPTGMTGGVIYDAHVQGIGWQKASKPNAYNSTPQVIPSTSDWFTNGQTAGTVTRSLRMEAFTVQLTGEIAKHYDVVYDSHVQNIGWQYNGKKGNTQYGTSTLYYQAPNFQQIAPVANWFKNGQEVGSNDHALRMEALTIKLVAKPTTTTTKNVTVNKDDKGKVLTNTNGYTKLSSKTTSATTLSNVYGDKILTNTTTNIWHKPITITKNVTVNETTTGEVLSSTAGYKNVSNPPTGSTVTFTSTASNGDKVITNTTYVSWIKLSTVPYPTSIKLDNVWLNAYKAYTTTTDATAKDAAKSTLDKLYDTENSYNNFTEGGLDNTVKYDVTALPASEQAKLNQYFATLLNSIHKQLGDGKTTYINTNLNAFAKDVAAEYTAINYLGGHNIPAINRAAAKHNLAQNKINPYENLAMADVSAFHQTYTEADLYGLMFNCMLEFAIADAGSNYAHITSLLKSNTLGLAFSHETSGSLYYEQLHVENVQNYNYLADYQNYTLNDIQAQAKYESLYGLSSAQTIK
ncbi:SEC10/PgrA surface exclusion domain-containing protein [Lactococcus hircilactis]|uniref:SEC10/PgrA surface exclusion domain-containing protein n=1 Tax=Lactococcus hircilactis TaxID=1494462 RepID=A0A7X1Z7C7_9LACT|nr:SEC10/PgrA surface exclusion domain-containing protein [Lactococcus hircilactis]MQW39101.1 SEC10/PgrA surface exclusion domain-containing protein [Lactococcus hircilactis]